MLTNGIATEKSRAQTAEQQLQQSIAAEQQRAEVAEQQLQGKIDADVAAEAARAQAAEEELNARKADEEGYHPKMSVGFSDNLVGRGESVDSQITFRPSGGAQSIEDGVARIERIKGNSIVWNQLAQVKSSQPASGVIIESDGTGSYTVYTGVDAPTTADVFFPITDTIVSGRKVLFFGAPSGASASTYCLKAQAAGTADVGSGAIVASTSTDEVIGIFIAAGTTINTAVKFTPQVFDLKMMFGAGYEPSTIEEFKALYPLAFYAYNAGELRSLSATAIKSVGFNLFDKNRAIANTLINAGNEVANNSYYCSGYIHVFSRQKYYLANIVNPYYYSPIAEYDCNKKYLRMKNVGAGQDASVYNTSGIYTPSSDAFYFRINIHKNYIGACCVNLSHTGYRNGEYEDYSAFERELPIKEYFPDGMKSAGAAYDEINANKAIKRIRVIEDISQLNWSASSTGTNGKKRFISGAISGATAIGGGTKGNLLVPNFTTVTAETTYSGNTTFPIIATTARALYLYNPAWVSYTIPQLKEAIAGIPAAIELAEPETIELSDPLNLDYKVSDFGTEEALFDGESAPLRADIVYGFNAVDTIRNNRTEIQALLARIEALEGKV